MSRATDHDGEIDHASKRRLDAVVSLLRAGSVGDNHAPALRIEIFEEITDDMTLTEARELYGKQGKQLADALFDTLPGGTVDALLCEMMKRRASLFMIPLEG